MSSGRFLVQFARIEIFGKVTPTKIDLKGWIANQGYFVDQELIKDSFVLRSSNTSQLQAALANDCNRMAIAAIESISGVQKDTELKNSGAWCIIRSYYASFFAIHSMLRMFGISCSQLEQTHVDKIFEMAKLTGQSGTLTKLENGFYSIKVDRNFNFVEFKKFKDSHKDTWGKFLELIDSLILDLDKGSGLKKQKLEAFDLLTALKKGITRSHSKDKGNWLSVIRNSVNYQHLYGVWFPYERGCITKDQIDRISNDWKYNPANFMDTLNKNDIEAFFQVSTLIIALFRELLIECAKKNKDINPIFHNGALKLLKILKAA